MTGNSDQQYPLASIPSPLCYETPPKEQMTFLSAPGGRSISLLLIS